MIEIDKPNIEIVDLSTQGSRSVGRFVVEPLERGFGTTLGNSMRRVLLSSLPGYAITSVKIDGVLHEFSTIPHVKEDVTEIVLNLKNIILKIHDEEPKTLYIEAKGEGEITAGDIKHHSVFGFTSTPSFLRYPLKSWSVKKSPDPSSNTALPFHFSFCWTSMVCPCCWTRLSTVCLSV